MKSGLCNGGIAVDVVRCVSVASRLRVGILCCGALVSGRELAAVTAAITLWRRALLKLRCADRLLAATG